MNLPILLLLGLIFNVSSLKLQSNSFLARWVTDQKRFNSFLIHKKDFASNATNSFNSSVVSLTSEYSKPLQTIAFNAKCYINDVNFSSIASSDLCPLQGKLGSYELLPDTNFLYILIDGCSTNGIDLIWILTERTDLKGYRNESMDKKFVFTDGLIFGDGSNDCSNLCENIQCILKTSIIIPMIVAGASVVLIVLLSIGGVFFFNFKIKANKIRALEIS